MIELCEKGIELNYSAKHRKGNIIELPPSATVVVSGDLHGHRRNFERIVSFADLPNNPQTCIVFQEILHGGPEDEFGGCLSFKLLADALEFQQQYPDQVYLMMGNHDTAVIGDNDVMKAGKEMNQALKDAMKRCFADEYSRAMLKLKAFLLSQPIAVRCPNRIWLSHSLPANRFAEDFDMTVFDRPLGLEDVDRDQPLYQLTWGRRHSQETLEKLADKFDVDFFVLGHQPQEKGWDLAGGNLIILASEHNHGCIMSVNLNRSYLIEDLLDSIVPLASIA